MAKTHCKNGHPRTPENMEGSNCKICEQIRRKKRWAEEVERKKAAGTYRDRSHVAIMTEQEKKERRRAQHRESSKKHYDKNRTSTAFKPIKRRLLALGIPDHQITPDVYEKAKQIVSEQNAELTRRLKELAL